MSRVIFNVNVPVSRAQQGKCPFCESEQVERDDFDYSPRLTMHNSYVTEWCKACERMWQVTLAICEVEELL